MMIRTTTTGAIPRGLGAGLRGMVQSALIKIGYNAINPVLDEIRSKPQPDSISRAYHVRHLLAGNAIRFEIYNTNPHWVYKEFDTRGAPRSWPPWAGGTSLNLWAREHGIEPFLVARKIYRYGTNGNYIFSQVWSSSGRKIDGIIRLETITLFRELIAGLG